MADAPRFIFSDIDGTFIDPDARVTPRTQEVVARALRSGAHFALATGRPHRWLAPVLEQLSVRPLCVTANGAILYDSESDHVVASHQLQPETMARIVGNVMEVMARYGGVSLAAERAGVSSGADALETLFAVDPTYSPDPVANGFGVADPTGLVAAPAVKLLLRNPGFSSAELYELIAPHVDPEDAHVTYSMDDGLLELAAPGVTKAAGVAELARRFGVAQEDTIAFGDMPNDIEMLRWAGTGVAMGNAADIVKRSADRVTATNRQDGLAQVLEEWF